MHPAAKTIEKFYRAFQNRDAETIASLYHPDARFTDPVFDLKGDEIGDMRRMFCTTGDDLQVSFSRTDADDTSGRAQWDARYTFTPTGRPVHNVVDASFVFDGGQIVTHTDTFDLAAWARQALGLSGALLVWTGFMKSRIREQAGAQLARYRRKVLEG
jgi:ketosteroid isomerase-like protein